MKKFGLLVCCCLLMAIAFGTLKAASLEIVSADTLVTALAGTKDRIASYINVKNISTGNVDVIVSASILEKTNKQKIQVCFAGGCFAYFPTDDNPDETEITYDAIAATLAPGQTTDETGNEFDCVIQNKDTLGETIVNFMFYNNANRKDFVSSTVKYRVTATGIESDELGLAQGARVFPNPARTAFTIEHGDATGTIEIYSATGEKVASRAIEFGSKQTSIETANMAPGTYFFTITSAGEKTSSGKFQVAK